MIYQRIKELVAWKRPRAGDYDVYQQAEEINMGFWGQDRKPDSSNNIWLEHLNIETGNWLQVFSACLGKMIAIQTACGELVVKGQDWNVDFSEGVILFGDQSYPLQFIGSEATSSDTWLWGWENINGFPEEMIQVATNAKVVGERWNLATCAVGCHALTRIVIIPIH